MNTEVRIAAFTPAARRRLIAGAAFELAETRGFLPGHEVEDWLAAETRVNRECGLIEPEPRWDRG